MMIQSKACGDRAPRHVPATAIAAPARCPRTVLAWRRRQLVAGCGALAAIGLVAGCAGGNATRAATPGMTLSTRSLVRVPRPDYANPASVAAAFYVAWSSVDAVHDAPTAFAARCAPLATGPLEEQLAASQPATAAWQAMQRGRLISLVRVRAVTRPDGAPAPSPATVYLRVYATRVTTTTSGRITASDGVTLRLSSSAGRWLVSAVLFY
jgi:hypothetical protein